MRYAKREVDDEPKKDELKGTQHRDGGGQPPGEKWMEQRKLNTVKRRPATRYPFESTLHSGEICFNWHTCEYCGRPSPGIPFARCNFCGARPSWHHGRCCPWRMREWMRGCTNPKEDGLAQEAGDQHLDAPSGWGIQPVAPPKQPSFSKVKCACCARQKGYEIRGWTQCGCPNCLHKHQESCPDCIMGRMPDENSEKGRPVCKCCWDPVEEIM